MAITVRKKPEVKPLKFMTVTVLDTIADWHNTSPGRGPSVSNWVNPKPVSSAPKGKPILCQECGANRSRRLILFQFAKAGSVILCFDHKDALWKLVRTIGNEEDYESKD